MKLFGLAIAIAIVLGNSINTETQSEAFVHEFDHALSAVAFDPYGRGLIVGEINGVIWDYENDEIILTIPANDRRIRDIVTIPEYGAFAIAVSSSEIQLIDSHTGDLLPTLYREDVPIEFAHSASSVSWNSISSQLASGHGDGSVFVWNLENNTLVTEFQHEVVVYDVDFSPDGRTLAVTLGVYPHNIHTIILNAIFLWDVESGEMVADIRPFDSLMVTSAFSPNGRYIASGGLANIISVWDLERNEELIQLEGHEESIQSLTFSPDGRLLASASLDGTVRLWDTSSWTVLAIYDDSTSGVVDVVFNNDGTLLASAGLDKTARVWAHGFD